MWTWRFNHAEEIYIATIQVAMYAEEGSSGVDFRYGLSELLRSADDFILDWTYVKVNGQFLYPTESYVNENYEEGEAFQ